MGKILYYDCFAGISGDMNLGALVDLGVDPDYLRDELGKLKIKGFSLEVEREVRKGISGTRVRVVVEDPENETHRHLRHIGDLIGQSTLSEEIKSKSLAIFNRIAEAEAKIHDIPVEKVHFHEVGALDSIADIVGAAVCQEHFGVDAVYASPVQLGGGFVTCAHGKMPVPAPATGEILRNVPVKTGLVGYEATTPTGAAILAATVNKFTPQTEMSIIRTGYGIGKRDGDIPNVLRVHLAESAAELPGDLQQEEALVIECNIDDMNPEWFAHVHELLFEAGASDVYMTPLIMKKSRPGNMLSVLCPRDARETVIAIILTGTSSIGLREYPVLKSMLKREVVTVGTRFGNVRVKRSYFNGRIVREKPEFEQCRQLAKEHNVSLEEVQKEVYKSL